jgi:hypothetical protein
MLKQIKKNHSPLRSLDQHMSETAQQSRSQNSVGLLRHAGPHAIDEILKLDHALWIGDVEQFLKSLPRKPRFDLVITSPPYNLGKPMRSI